jgi:S1-C subfamily serine protease
LLAGVGIGACVTTTSPLSQPLAPATTVPALPGAAIAAPGYQPDSEPIVKAVSVAASSVVSIDTTAQQSRRVLYYDEYGDLRRGVQRSEVPAGAGSGVLLEGGYVITNEHVIEPALENSGTITIRLDQGKKYRAEVVGADRSSDIALLRVTDARGKLPVASLGNKDSLRPGQTVIAIGNPVGLSASVSAGVVSALGRPLEMEDRVYENLIQTDTAINPGNSGGALVDLGGRVVGINTLVRRDAQNIGFAIPIQTALRVADELKQYGKVRRPWTGFVPRTMEPRFAEIIGVPAETQGVVVLRPQRSSPAVQAGLTEGDVIVSMNGQTVTNEESYRRLLNSLKIGQTVEVIVQRGNQRGVAKLRLVEAP